MATYLVTGATGLIGRHVVDELLRRDETDRVLVLTRSSSLDRLDALRHRWPNADRVEPVIGDLGRPLLGIEEATLQGLIDQVDHVIHLAALYDITADDEEQRRGQRGRHPRRGRARLGHRRRMSAPRVLRRRRRRLPRRVHRGHVRRGPAAAHRRTTAPSSPAEKLVREQHEVPWRVYRPAIVVGQLEDRRDGQDRRPVLLLPRHLAARRPAASCRSCCPTSATPTSCRSTTWPRRWCSWSAKPGLDGRTFHLVNPEPQPITKVYDAFARAAGAPTVTAQLPRACPTRCSSWPKLAELRARRDHRPRRGAGPAGHPAGGRLGVGVPRRRSTRPRPSGRWPAAASRSRALADYASVLWRYWREHLDPFRARRHGQGGELDGRRIVITGASSGIGRVDRAEGRRTGRDPAAGRAARDGTGGGARRDPRAGRRRLRLPVRPDRRGVGEQGGRGDARRARRRRHAGQQRGPVDPPLGRPLLRPDARLRARHGDQLLRRGPADPGAAAADDRNAASGTS